MSDKDLELLDFCVQLPKVELHAHLNGSISDDTIHKLIEQRQKVDKGWTPPADWAVTIQAGDQRSLEHCFAVFRLLHELSTTEDVAYMVTRDVIREFAADNVKYLELRTTPRDVPATGMTKRSYIEAVIRAIKDSGGEDITVRLLLAVDRRVSVAEAEDVVAMAMDLLPGGIVVGVDLSGDPSKGKIADFIPVFKKAKQQGLKLALHLAEASYNVEETEEFLESLLPDRIGHGTYLHSDVGGKQAMVDKVVLHKIPLELCLTSNLKSNTVKTLSSHHLAYWMKKEHPIALSTDDKGVFCTSLSREYALAADTFSLNRAQLFSLSERAVDHVFACDDVRQRLRDTWAEARARLLGGNDGNDD